MEQTPPSLLAPTDASGDPDGLAPDVPERYRLVAVLMAFDMGSWQEKDLGEIARKMNNIQRRLELSRGGPHTQKL
jgi:hypothetical protein